MTKNGEKCPAASELALAQVECAVELEELLSDPLVPEALKQAVRAMFSNTPNPAPEAILRALDAATAKGT